MGVNTQAIVDHWDEIRERLREHWENLTDEDLEMVRDNLNEVIGRIQLRTGEARRDIQRFVNQFAEEGYDLAGRAKGRAAEFASSAADVARERADRAARRAADGLHRAEEVVREYPAPSVLTVFGLGCLAGLLVAWFSKSDR
jgi:ElaB/YqjD/DUF883 family membrane-anchored ribosome-binding protein